MTDIKRIADKFDHINSKYVLVAFFAILPFVGILPQSVIAIAVIFLCLILSTTDDLYLALPIMLFYYMPFGSLLGMSVYRWYTFIYVFYAIYKRYKKSRRITGILKWDKAIPLLIYYLFCVFALAVNNVRTGIFAFFDVVFILVIVDCELSNSERLKKFFSVWAVTSVFAFVSGLIINNSEQYAELLGNGYLTIVRNNATFEDPNYMGFFYTISAFSVIILKPFKKIPNIILTVAINLMLLSSLSMSAIVVNILIWLIYFALTKKQKTGKILIGTAIFVVLLLAFNMALKYGDSSQWFVQLALRINEKINYFLIGDTAGLTTNRSSLSEAHFELFLQQPIWRQLIGMNPVGSLSPKGSILTNVAHNEYIDWLHNIGIIGAVLMGTFLVMSLYRAYTDYQNENTKTNLFVVILKCCWILYAFTLTVFMDPRFMIPFLI